MRRQKEKVASRTNNDLFDIEKSSATYSHLHWLPACSLLSYTQIDRRILGTRLIFFINTVIYDYLYTGCLSLKVFLTCAFFESKEYLRAQKKLIKPFFFHHTQEEIVSICQVSIKYNRQVEQTTDFFPAFLIECVALSANESSWSNSIRYHRRYLKERLQSSSTKEASAYHLLHQQNPVSTKTFDGEHYFRVLHEMVGFYIRLEVRWHFFCSC